MAYGSINTLSITLEAGSDLSAKQFYAVALASDGQVDVAGLGDFVVGILQNKPDAAGRAASIAVLGISKWVSGGTIAKGAAVGSTAAGTAIGVTAGTCDTTTSSATQALVGGNVVGIAIDSSVSGDTMSVLLLHAGLSPTTEA